MTEHPAALEALHLAAEKHRAEARSRRTKLRRERRKRAKANERIWAAVRCEDPRPASSPQPKES